MESLKEKNKKHARRFGMNKKELLSLALAGAGILGLAAGNVIAGMSVVPKNVALEIIPASPSNSTTTLRTSEILVDGILAGNNTRITLQLQNGFFPGNATIKLCRENTEVANGTVSPSDNSTVVLTFNETVGSTNVLRFVYNDTNSSFNCTDNKADGLPVKIRGGLNDGDTVNLNVHTFTGTLFRVKQQYTATLTKATDFLDPDKEYKKLKSDKKDSNDANYRISDSNPDITVNASAGRFEISLSGDFTGVANATVYAPIGNTTSLVTLKAANSWKGSSSIGNFSSNGTIRITVNGTDVLTPRTFKVSLKTVPGTGNIAREIYLLQDAVSHEWLLPGVTYYIPFVVARPGDETYIVLQAKKGPKSSYTVTISALDDNGDFKSINAIPMNAGDRLVITASQIKAQIPSLTKERFVVMINVDGDESNIFAYANICSANGICRRVPVKAQDGKIVE
jgi:hypothetical protein